METNTVSCIGTFFLSQYILSFVQTIVNMSSVGSHYSQSVFYCRVFCTFNNRLFHERGCAGKLTKMCE